MATTYGTRRIHFKCTNKACKHVWIIQADLDAFMNPYAELQPRLRFYYQKNGTCPKCKRPAAQPNIIKARTNDTPCDSRCTHARGHDCECSCGGKNHGLAHQLPTV